MVHFSSAAGRVVFSSLGRGALADGIWPAKSRYASKPIANTSASIVGFRAPLFPALPVNPASLTWGCLRVSKIASGPIAP